MEQLETGEMSHDDVVLLCKALESIAAAIIMAAFLRAIFNK